MDLLYAATDKDVQGCKLLQIAMLVLQLQLQQVSAAPPNSALLTMSELKGLTEMLCSHAVCASICSNPAAAYVEAMSAHCISVACAVSDYSMISSNSLQMPCDLPWLDPTAHADGCGADIFRCSR